MRFTLRGTRLVDATMDVAKGDIAIDGKHIQAVGRHLHSSGENVIEAEDTIVMPGFIDVHAHGGGGYNLHTTDVEEIYSYARWTPETGVTSFLVTVVGTPSVLPESQLQTACEAVEHSSRVPGAEPLGIFMEGPYINEKRRGAHLPVWLRMPDERETERILDLVRGHLSLITVAPELPGATQMIQHLVDAGVTVSIGHSDADYKQTKTAFQLGITHATHCFNAMRPLLHRAPGPIAAIAQAPQVRGELIADGVHVHPAAMEMLIRMLGPERTIVVTDALAGAGLSDTTFEFAGQPAHISCGAAHLSDGTLTGSVLTMDKALLNVLEMTHVSLQQAVGMLTLNPACSVHVDHCKGLLRAGFDADLLVFNSALRLQATICRGEVAFATDEWCQRFKGL